MILQLDKTSLFSLFNVEGFEFLEDALNTMAPSMVEYYLSDLGNTSNEEIYLNKKNVEDCIKVGEYSIYKDYNTDVFLEIDTVALEEYETGSLW